jgi:peroxiredoxin
MVALDSESDVLQRGDPAPDFDLRGTDNDQYSLASFGGHEALLVVFTCNHCPYAEAKFEELNALAAEFDDVAVVGINANDPEEYPDDAFDRMVALTDDGTIAYDAYLQDADQSVAAAYGARCTPDPYLFAMKDGRFRLAYHGRLDDAMSPDDEPSEREMRQHIQTVLAGESVTADQRPSRGCSIKWREGNEPDYWEA